MKKMKAILNIIFFTLYLSITTGFAQDSFTDIPGITGGQINDIQLDASGNLYATNRIDNKIYTSSNNGNTWTILSSVDYAYAVLADGADLYYTTYDRMYKSTDTGNSWQLVTTGTTFKNPTRLFKLPNDANTFVMQSECEGVYVTPDAGVNWTRISKNTACVSGRYNLNFTSAGDIYFPERTLGIVRHTYPVDGVWSASKSEVIFAKEVPESEDYILSVGVNATDNIYITYRNVTYDHLVAVSASGDSGSFTSIAGPSTNYNSPLWSTSPTGLLYLVSNYPSKVWELTDDITPTWTEKVAPGFEYNEDDIRFFYWKSDVELYAGNSDYGIFFSSDGSASWTIKNGTSPDAIETPYISDIEVLPNDNIIAHRRYVTTKGFWTSTDQGASFNWSPQSFSVNSQGFAGSSLVKLQDGSIAFVSNDGVRTSNDGVTWTLQGAQTASKITVAGNQLIMIRNTNPTPAELGISIDKGANWTNTPITGGFPVDFNVEQLLAINNYVLAYIYNYSTSLNEWWRVDKTSFIAEKLIAPFEYTSNAFVLNSKVYLSNGQTVAISEDEGSAWSTFDYQHSFLVPIRQGTGGIGLSSNGTFAITQDDGTSFRTVGLNSATAVITDLAQDASGTFYGSCERGPAVKFTDNLILPDSELPPTYNLTWEQKSGPYGGAAMQLQLNSSNQLYVTNNEMLYKQNDGANAWDRVAINNHYCCYSDMTIGNADNIYFNANGQVYKSIDGGATWSSSYNGNAQKIRVAANGNYIAATYEDLKISTDDGASYQTPAGVSPGNFDDLEVDSNGNLWASGRSNETSLLYNSVDNGLNWSIVSGIDLSSSQDVFSINKLESGAIAVVTTDDIYKTTDNGATWVSIKGNLTATHNVNDPYWSKNSKIYLNPGGEYYFFNSQFLFKSTDNGTTWLPIIKRSNYDDLNGYFTINDIIWYNSKMLIATENNGVLESEDDGVTIAAFQENRGFYQSYNHNDLIVYDENVKLFIDNQGRNKIIRTTDDGQSFSTILNDDYFQGIKKSFNGDIIGYGGRFFKSSDKGETWIDLNSEFNGWGRYLTIPDDASGSYYAATENNGWKYRASTDLVSWNNVDVTGLPNNYSLNQLEAGSNDILYAVIYDYDLNRSLLYAIYPFSGAELVSEVENPQQITRKNGKIYVYGGNELSITSDGNSWTHKSVPSGNQFYVAGNGYIFITYEHQSLCWLSTTEGDIWQNIGGLLGDKFQGIDIDMTNGHAYAIAENQPLLKSSSILLEDDQTAPILSSMEPAHNEINVPTYFSITLHFDEAVKGVNGKKIRLYDIADQSEAKEIFDASEVTFLNSNKSISIKPTEDSISLGVTYFVIVDKGAFTDVFDNAYTGIINSTGWNFTISETPTLEDPVFNFTWEQTNGPYGGTARQLVVNSVNDLYVTNDEMLYKQDEEAGAWERVAINNHYCCYSDIIVDDADNIYFLDSYQLLKFTSGSTSTAWTNSSGGGQKVRKADNGNIILARYDRLSVSMDDGVTYQNPAGISPGYFDDLEIDSNGNLWASGRFEGTSILYNSIDNGENWTTVSGVDLSSSQDVFSINNLELGAIAVVTTDDIYKTTDNGATWVSIKGNLATTHDTNDPYWGKNSKLYVSPANEYYFYNSVFLYKSTDNGVSWAEINERASNDGLNGYFTINDIKWYNSKMLIATENSGVLESEDGGVTLSTFQENKGFYQSFNHNNLVVVDGVKLFLDYQGVNKVVRTADDGQSYTAAPTDFYIQGIKKLENGDLVAHGDRFQLSTDKGATWTDLNTDFSSFSNYLTVPSGTSESYYTATSPDGTWTYWESNDLITWTEISVTGLPENYYLNQLAADSAGKLYALLYDYTNNVNLVYIISSGVASLADNITYPQKILENKGEIYVFGNDQFGEGKMYLTSDGNSWEQKSVPSGNKFFVTENGYIFITNDYFPAKCWLSADEGDKWQNVGGILGDDFEGIDIDMTNGYAYAVAQNQPLLKSSTILLQDDKTGPVLASTYPANTDNDIPIDVSLVLNFDEVLQAVSGKTISLFNSTNPTTAIDTFDVSSVTYTNERTTVVIKPTSDLSYLTSYFVHIDEGAFTDIFGNAYGGIIDNTTWVFTTAEVPDTEDPVMSFTTSNYLKGAVKSYQLSMTDNKSISMNTTKILYRGISALESETFKSAVMTAVAGGTITETDFTVTADDSWYDGMGLEFYFEGEDVAGNKVRLPDSIGYFYSYIDFESAQSRPDVKGMSFGDTESSYRIISIPHKLNDVQIATQFDELGTSDGSNWRMFHYDGTSEYEEFPVKLTTLERGKGYWIILKSSITVFLENAVTPENNRDNFYSINLRQGWNQIGNPYTVPISWDEVRAQDQTTIGVLKTYLDGNYINGNVLQPYEGGFVFSESAVSVKVRFQGITSGGRVENVGSDISKQNWELPIKISQGEFGNEIGGIGMRVNALKGKDQYDDYNPPALSKSVELRIHEGRVNDFAKSVVPTQSEYVWEFTTVATGTELSTLSWDNTQLGENDKELYLLDIAQQRLINMRSESSYKFIPSKSKNFKLYFGANIASSIKPSTSVFGSPFPNPATDHINFSFTIGEDDDNADVSLRIYNNLGERVAEVISDKFESGFYFKEVSFSVSELPKGIYFTKWVMENARGNIKTDINKIIIK